MNILLIRRLQQPDRQYDSEAPQRGASGVYTDW